MSLTMATAIYTEKMQRKIFMSLAIFTTINTEKMRKRLLMNQDMSAAKSMKFYTRRKFLTVTMRWPTVI